MTIKTITIYQGDSLIFNNYPGLPISFNTTINMTGFKGRFEVGQIIKDFNINPGNTHYIALSKDDTAKLPMGEILGYCKIFDTKNEPLTLQPIVKFIVKQKVVEN